MQVPAGDERTKVLLLKRYNAVGCYYCRAQGITQDVSHPYLSCPHRPCYLCKKQGHISISCPYRIKPRPPPPSLANKYTYLRQRELIDTVPHPGTLDYPDRQADASAVVIADRIHSSRITAAEWHPSGRFVVSGDKRGELMLWQLGDAVQEEGVNAKKIPRQSMGSSYVHEFNVNQIAFDNDHQICYTTSSDGLVCALRLDLLSGQEGSNRNNAGECVSDREVLLNLNPNGWEGSMAKFKRTYGLCYHPRRRCIYTGVSDGTVIVIDPREAAVRTRARFHRDKVTGIDVNPVVDNLLVTASNDRKASLWDLRKFAPGHALGWYHHGGVVSSAYFSPVTGEKLLTTSTDNRIHVWDTLHKFFGDVNQYEDSNPISFIHSHDFHRHLNAFRATWDPKDWRDDRFVCGRFLGEAYKDEEDDESILHPVDIFSVKERAVTASLVDMNVPLKCPLNKFWKGGDAILSAASMDLIIWSPSLEKKEEREGENREEGEAEEPDEENVDPKKKKKRFVLVEKKKEWTRGATRRGAHRQPSS